MTAGPSKYIEAVRTVVADLGLENANIKWRYVSGTVIDGKRICGMAESGWGRDAQSTVTIALGWPEKDVYRTICHELRHIKQYYEGWISLGLARNSRSSRLVRKWNGSPNVPRRVDNIDRLPYTERPHELDAFWYENYAMEKFFGGGGAELPQIAARRMFQGR